MAYFSHILPYFATRKKKTHHHKMDTKSPPPIETEHENAYNSSFIFTPVY
jgi:hypothetical protein